MVLLFCMTNKKIFIKLPKARISKESLNIMIAIISLMNPQIYLYREILYQIFTKKKKLIVWIKLLDQ